MKIGNKKFDIKNRTYIMGILNVTPDSFSDGGKYQQFDTALQRVEEMAAQGADIIDVGGESTRPGYHVISSEQEIQRVVPVIEQIKKRFDIPVSVDTCKSSVALAAISAGADLVNDIWGLKFDEKMATVIAERKVPCCLMHNRSEEQLPYEDLMQDILSDLKKSIAIGLEAGIEEDKIIIDPGIGFAKDCQQNLAVVNQLEIFHELNCPILLGASRKSMIGNTLGLPVDERVEGTLVTTVLAVMKGCAFVRVHDIKENRRAIQMTEAILNKSY